MKLVYAYPAEMGRGVEAEIVGTLRDRCGHVVQTGREERDSERGGATDVATDVIVTLEVEERCDEALNG